jgi:alcohol dehydrogenase (cytochrome c)
MRSFMKFALAAVFVGIVGVAVALTAVPELRWRAHILVLSATGQIPGVSFAQLVRMMAPGSGYYIAALAETRNPYYSISNPLNDAESVKVGQTIFSRSCAECHGHKGIGASAPGLVSASYKHGDSDWAIFSTVSRGIPGTGMASQDLDEKQIWNVVAYLRRLRLGAVDEAPEEQFDVQLVTSERLTEDDSEPGNWLGYNGGYSGHRYSELDQVNRTNVASLRVKWIHQFRNSLTLVETSPIVNGSVMYVTEPPNIVHALNSATGSTYWTYAHQNADDLKLCCGQVNRGVAVHGGIVYLGTLDAHLVAIDAATGKLRWKVKLADHQQGASITSAPLVVGDLVIVGYGGGDLGFRGFIDALSVVDGSRRWRFYSIPGPGEPGNETWSGDSWKTGGGATWLTGVYDPQLDLLYWGVGNPGPDYQGDLRKGDNLYSSSVLALKPASGELVWHFQFTPHDERDWDSNQIPALVNMPWKGEQRKLMLWPNRNGFYYVLDRATGEYLQATQFVQQNWAKGIDESGRPISDPTKNVSIQGTATWPSNIGAINWQSPSYSPRTRLHYLPALIWGGIIYKHPIPADYRPGDLFLGGEHHPIPGVDLYYSIRAIDPTTGEAAWTHDLPKRSDWWKTGGLVSTAGDVVFGGDDTELFVLDATSGQELWRLDVGGRINASPITYLVDGEQVFAIAAGRSIIALGLPANQTTEAAAEGVRRLP